jgi:ribosomal protein L7/L12
MGECQHCRQPISDTARFCENCGASVHADDPVSSELANRIRELVADGQKIEAIRVLREATGLGLAEAKHMVESGMAAPPDLPDGDFERELVTLVQSGQKIEAIKRHRERTGMGLKESKDAVESLAARHGIVSRGAGCAGVLVLGLLVSLGVILGFAGTR